MIFSCFGNCFAALLFFFNGFGEPSADLTRMVGYIHFLVWDSLRMHSKQQNSQWEIHEYIDLLNFVCLNAFIACSILYF